MRAATVDNRLSLSQDLGRDLLSSVYKTHLCTWTRAGKRSLLQPRMLSVPSFQTASVPYQSLSLALDFSPASLLLSESYAITLLRSRIRAMETAKGAALFEIDGRRGAWGSTGRRVRCFYQHTMHLFRYGCSCNGQMNVHIGWTYHLDLLQ